MLSRRLFRQLTDSFLLGPRAGSLCFCAKRAAFVRQDSSRVFPRGTQVCAASSSTRWRSRQFKDHFAREAKVQGLKSRAAFKLVEINDKYRIFKSGMTVIDLGYAPGSWSQVAITMTQPNGRVVGIDIIPAQPPKGVSTIQGNFLSPEVQAEVRAYVRDPNRGRPRSRTVYASKMEAEAEAASTAEADDAGSDAQLDENADRGYIDMERHLDLDVSHDATIKEKANVDEGKGVTRLSRKKNDEEDGRVVDVVLSDMMMNTSGIPFRDHAGSMDLCMAALTFCYDTLRTGGHFLCKFYQGQEDKAFELKLRKLFEKVHREKPDSSRSESKEAYFVALRRKSNIPRNEVFTD